MPNDLRILLSSLMLFPLLGGCVSFSDAHWTDYAGNGLCAETKDVTKQQADDLPIWLITTRLPDCRELPYRLTIQRGEKLRYGRLKAYGKPESPKRAELLFQQKDQWWLDIAQKASEPKSRGRVLVYIHGFNNSLDENAVRASQMRYYSGFSGPVVVFSWPSHERYFRYTVDDTNQRWNQLYLTRTLAHLATLDGIEEIVLVAHSMGSKGAIRALVEIDQRWPDQGSKFRRIILASSDMDRQYFEQQASMVLLTPDKLKNGRTITLFVSEGDRAVGLSKFLHGYDRVGVTDCSDPVLRKANTRCYAGTYRNADGTVTQNDNTTLMPGLVINDTTKLSNSFIGHNDYLDSPEVREFFCQAVMERDYADNAPSYPRRIAEMDLDDMDKHCERQKPMQLENKK